MRRLLALLLLAAGPALAQGWSELPNGWHEIQVASPTGTGTPATLALWSSASTLAAGPSYSAGQLTLGDLAFSGTTSTGLHLKTLTTAQRDLITASAGDLIYNSTTQRVEAYDGAAWHGRVRLDGDTMTGALSLGANSLTAGSVIVGTGGVLTSATSAVLTVGNAPNATPTSRIVQGESSRGGTDTDVAGANLTIRSGAGTGAATPASLLFQIPAAAASGSTQQTQFTRLTISSTSIASALPLVPDTTDVRALGTTTSQWNLLYLSRATIGSKTKTLTESVDTGYIDIAVTAGQRISGEIIYEVFASDATDHQVLTGKVIYAAVNKGGTVTASIGEASTPVSALSSGTLTATNTVLAGTDKITVRTNAVSSLTQSTLEVRYRVNSVSANTLTPL